jgi:hypothetical protein
LSHRHLSGGAAVAVVVENDVGFAEFRKTFDVENRLFPSRNLQLKLLVEIAVVDAAQVVDADRVPAHQAGERLRVEVVDQQLHVVLRQNAKL